MNRNLDAALLQSWIAEEIRAFGRLRAAGNGANPSQDRGALL